MEKILALIQLLRPINCFMVGLAVLVGEVIAYGAVSLSHNSVLGFIVGFSICGAAMVSNDYWDRFIDSVNMPSRPIPSGKVTPIEAAIFTVILSICGLAAAYMNGLPCLVIATIGLLISLEYNYRWKKLGFPGNIMVSAGIALPLLYGGLVHGWPAESLDRVTVLILFEAMIFLANLGREISKGIADMEGDRLKNIETLALRYGPKKAARAASAFYISAVALSFIPPITSSVSRLYIPLVAIADVGFIASAFTLVRDFTKEGALRVKSMVLLWMLIGLLAFILGAFR